MLRPIVAILILAAPSLAAPLRIVSWNVESGGADSAVISEQLADLGCFDAYCLQEVAPSNLARYAYAIREAYGNRYRFIG